MVLVSLSHAASSFPQRVPNLIGLFDKTCQVPRRPCRANPLIPGMIAEITPPPRISTRVVCLSPLVEYSHPGSVGKTWYENKERTFRFVDPRRHLRVELLRLDSLWSVALFVFVQFLSKFLYKDYIISQLICIPNICDDRVVTSFRRHILKIAAFNYAVSMQANTHTSYKRKSTCQLTVHTMVCH